MENEGKKRNEECKKREEQSFCLLSYIKEKEKEKKIDFPTLV
jgi:hypothetical protein